MKISIKWLQDYIDIKLPPKELAERITMSGTEVGGVDVIGGSWDGVMVGEVVALQPHPNADRLKLATVDLGGERTTVVCGAPNIKVGDRVPFARVGAQLVDGHTGKSFRLQPAKIRGVVSEGMVCSEKELGISDEHLGIMVLQPDAPLGAPLADYLGDVILDLDVTPNRPDCLSVIGVAREIAALTGQRVRLPDINYQESAPGVDEAISVEVIDTDLCGRYCASLITGIKVAPSPRWMQRRLLACGMRPINNIVDITNYVMLEYGQPLHAFDYEAIGGGKIKVRRSRTGETIITLDGTRRVLNEDMLVIADEEFPIAVAGVMGGAGSEVGGITTSILLEAASFDPASIRRTSIELDLRSEASIRFERGISPELTIPALRHATRLMVELGGGRAASGIVDVYPGRREREPICLSTAEVKRLLGMEFDIESMVRVLTSLGFECQVNSPDELCATAPHWRTDVNLPADLVEEIARITGYDHLPTTMLSAPIPRQQSEPILALEERVRDILVGCGLQEVISYSLIGKEMLERAFPSRLPVSLRIANPLSRNQEYLRASLRPGLLTILASNQKHEENDIGLFEVGKIYLPRENDLPDEQGMLTAVSSGSRGESSWLGSSEGIGFFDAKGVVGILLERLGVEVDFQADERDGLYPGRTARISIHSEEVGIIGQLHPAVVESFDICGDIYLFEINLSRLLPFIISRKYQPLPRFPGVVRDVAVVVEEELSSRRIENIIQANPLVTQVTLFDVYSGEQVPPGKKSLAFRILYQSPTRTLTDEDVDRAQKGILDKLRHALGATLRG